MSRSPNKHLAAYGFSLLALALAAGGLDAGLITPLTSPDEFSPPATGINFDGAPGGTVANTLYLDQGVRFGRDDGLSVFLLDWQALGRGTTSPPNVLATISGSGFGFVTHLNVLFDAPALEVGAFFGNDQLKFGGFPSLTLSVYDALDNLLGSVTVPTNNNTDVDQFVGLRSEVPFVRARFQNNQTNDFAVVIDDFIFSRGQPIPEPSALALLGAGALGVLGLAGRRRRRPPAESRCL